ncbi:2OG-Fe(II) oxygenase [Lysobacter sp. N42]|uniref:2OG-Fe(II) oxygenase n=1 Tax=Lysobacter sp. N42 TaxID=2545719 RepID=UPI0010430F53|nr:2OG-Fe(II) oxygenase [Lysobacter sp. N42]TCZ86041.1 2OG-Fe(II) oxygenase [Lysobacter sp. N42]
MNEPGAALTPARRYGVDGRTVAVFDGLLPEVGQHVEALARAPFTRTEVARPETAQYKHWVNEIRLEVLTRQPILQTTLHAVASLGVGEYRPYRAYTNVASYGDMLFTHTDCLPGQRELTALWYICTDWDQEWGGETVFYDHAGELACAVRPRPGRLVIFDGTIVHAGRPPHRICYAPRYTLAIKLEPVQR